VFNRFFLFFFLFVFFVFCLFFFGVCFFFFVFRAWRRKANADTVESYLAIYAERTARESLRREEGPGDARIISAARSCRNTTILPKKIADSLLIATLRRCSFSGGLHHEG